MESNKLLPDQFIYADENHFCIRRVKKGKGFSFLDEWGRYIPSGPLLKRLKSLTIPPMWTDVWICTVENGHLQAIGRDTKGRKQYIYHPQWAFLQQLEKFDKMIEFGKKLPLIRKKVHQDLNDIHWSKRKILALMVLILDETGIRIGNKNYLEENGTYGLSTLRRKHLIVDENELIFKYKGKSHQKREVKIDDEELIHHIKNVAELPGYEIFKYQDPEGKTQVVDSHDVNQYIGELSKEKFSSKDFRTWVGSRLTLECIPEAHQLLEINPRKKFLNLVLKLVSQQLGNTISVCRTYYIHPKILHLLENNEIPFQTKFRSSRTKFGLTAEEKLLMQLIGD
jgi:DNA topoisomerase I